MRAIIFYSVAEYCDHASKMTIKQNGKEVRVEICMIEHQSVSVVTKKYLTQRIAYRAYLEKIGKAIEGQWKVLNSLPQRETWEVKRTK